MGAADTSRMMDRLAAAAAHCSACSLATLGRTAPVFGTSAASRLVFCGEAPGAAEDIEGVPFVGRSGRLLHRAIAEAHVDVTVGFVNTVMCRPPGNRAPSAAETSACALWLFPHLMLLRPEVIVVLGASAARALGVLRRTSRLSDSFDTVFEIPFPGRSVRVVTAWHPAAVLRSRSRYPELVAQIAAASDLLKSSIE